MKKTSSVVWQFFDRLQENNRCVAVLCKLCERQFKYFGNTTNLRVHLTKKHPVQWDMRQMHWDGPKTMDESSVIHHVDILESNDSEVDQDREAAMNLVREMHNDDSDEEWLEEECPDRIEISEPPTKRNKSHRRIKREAISPPPKLSNLFSTPQHHSKSAKTEHYIIGDSRNNDEYSVFGEYIANKLRKFKTPRTRGNVQQLITTILWQAEYGIYDDVNAVKRMLMVAAQLPESTEKNVADDDSHQLMSDVNQSGTNEDT